ncbi:MAG: RidA family protein [Burkholderiales bacterium]
MKKRVLRPKGLVTPPLPYSQAIQVGDWVFIAGQLATDFDVGIAADARISPHLPFHSSPVKLQTRHIYRNIQAIMEEAGSSADNLVRVDQFTTSKSHVDGYLETRNEFITKDRPASTAVQMEGLMVADAVIEVDAIGVVPRKGFEKSAIHTDKVAKPLAGYSVGIRAGAFVFGAGASPTDFKGAAAFHGTAGTGLAPEARVDPNFWYGSPIKRQTAYDLHKLGAYFEAGGCALKDCVKAQIYLSYMEDYYGFQESWREAFGNRPPATTVVPVKGMGIHESRIEINVIGVVPNAGVNVEVIEAKKAPAPLGHEPHAIRAGELLFLSGLMACDGRGPIPPRLPNAAFPFLGSSAKHQMRVILEHAGLICEAAGASLADIVRAQIFYTDLRDLAPSLEVWAGAFPEDPPVCSFVQVHDRLPVPGCTILVDFTAVCG